MLYTLNNNYVLRQELNDCYRLYNKKTLRSYTISYKLFFILDWMGTRASTTGLPTPSVTAVSA